MHVIYTIILYAFIKAMTYLKLFTEYLVCTKNVQISDTMVGRNKGQYFLRSRTLLLPGLSKSIPGNLLSLVG